MLLEPGQTIGGYRVVDRLHFGGMAVLYRVHADEAPGQTLVMKVPRLAQGEDPVSVVSYEVEEMMLRALDSPHAPRLVGVGDMETEPFLVLEYIDGPVLKDWVDRGPLPIGECIKLGVRISAAVHQLHCQQLVHLDLKPGNIMFRGTANDPGAAVIIDFGLAHHAHYPDLLAEEFSKPMGSAPYMAPEQVVGVRCDPRSDVFAIGAILYHLATGTMPFGAPSSVSGLRERLYRDPVPPRAINPDLPEWFQEIVLKCLEVNARDRYGTAAQIAFDLTHADQVLIGNRGRQRRAAGPWTRFKRWIRAAGYEPAPCPPPSETIAAAPIIMVAVATQHHVPEQTAALQQVVRQLAQSGPDHRIALVTVIRPQPLLGTSQVDSSSGKEHLRHLVDLRHWADPLGLPEGRCTFHVLEETDPVAALLHYAGANHVSQIVIGAPPVEGNTKLGVSVRPVYEAVAARVALEAQCTVTVVRSAGSRQSSSA